jgi:deoxyribodipyrimidine photo-lyase
VPADHLALLYVVSPPERLPTRWGFARSAPHRRKFRDQALAGLSREITHRGGDSLIAEGRAVDVVPCLAKEIGAEALFCEAIAAPDEIAELESIHRSGLLVYDVWRSSLIDLADLPFELKQLPDVFTSFRRAVESAVVVPRPALPAPSRLPASVSTTLNHRADVIEDVTLPESASFSFTDPEFHGTETTAMAHVERYFSSPATQVYKQTRNELKSNTIAELTKPSDFCVRARLLMAELVARERENFEATPMRLVPQTLQSLVLRREPAFGSDIDHQQDFVAVSAQVSRLAHAKC